MFKKKSKYNDEASILARIGELEKELAEAKKAVDESVKANNINRQMALRMAQIRSEIDKLNDKLTAMQNGG